jgi:hypothetical protein
VASLRCRVGAGWNLPPCVWDWEGVDDEGARKKEQNTPPESRLGRGRVSVAARHELLQALRCRFKGLAAPSISCLTRSPMSPFALRDLSIGVNRMIDSTDSDSFVSALGTSPLLRIATLVR